MGHLSDLQLKVWVKARKPVSGKSDGQGLTFTLSSKGAASWVLRYRHADKARELTLGRYPDMTLSKAREIAAVKRVEVQQLVDVAAVKQQKKAEAKQAHNVSQLAELWLDNAIRRRHKHPEVTERVFKRDILPALGKKDASKITTAEVTRLLAKINASGRPTISNDVLRYLKAMFAYGEVLEVVDRNPADRIKIEHAGGREKPRDRALSQTEITKLFIAIQTSGPAFGRDNELAVKLLLVLACRKMELFAARWVEFDLPNKLWRIPASNTKAGESRELPLPSDVIDWLNEMKIRACGSEYVFPARRKSKRFKHVSPDTTWHALRQLKHDLEPFTVHDLRRTSRSLMADLSIPFDVAEKILGHKLPGVAAIYDRGGSIQQQRVGLEKLGGLIVQLDGGNKDNNIVLMKEISA